MVSQEDQEKLIHAFISSSLDNCNGLFTGQDPKSPLNSCSSFRMLLLEFYAGPREHYSSYTICALASSKLQNTFQVIQVLLQV